MKGIEYLRRKLKAKRGRTLLRYGYYDMKHWTVQMDPTIPLELRNYLTVMGWCGAAVDQLADRLVFREFRGDDFGINEFFTANNSDIFFDSAVLGALITACDFAYVYEKASGMPGLRVIDGTNATGVMDLNTMLLTEGYAILEVDQETDRPILEAYFLPNQTDYYVNGVYDHTDKNPAGTPLLVPIVNRPDANREFGHSRISRACMGYMNSALQTVRKSEIAAYFYSFPQRYALGFESQKGFDKWKASMTAMLTIGRDENDNLPQVGQFPQQSMVPYTDHLRMFAALFAGETGLTMDDLGFVQANPTSDDAIQSSHEALRLKARKSQRGFGACFKNVGYTAACLRDRMYYDRSAFAALIPIWEPIFEPTMGRIGAFGDAVFKLNEAAPGYVDANTIYDLTGIRPSEGVTNGTGNGGSAGAGALGSYFNGVSESNDEGQTAGETE